MLFMFLCFFTHCIFVCVSLCFKNTEKYTRNFCAWELFITREQKFEILSLFQTIQSPPNTHIPPSLPPPLISAIQFVLHFFGEFFIINSGDFCAGFIYHFQRKNVSPLIPKIVCHCQLEALTVK